MLYSIKPNLQQIQPEWTHLSDFVAKSSLLDQITRIGNYSIFALALVGVCSGQNFGRRSTYLHQVCLFLAVRKVLCVIAGYIGYKATHLSKSKLLNISSLAHSKLRKKGFLFNTINLHKSGICYVATWISTADTLDNKVWVVNALGVTSAMEENLYRLAKRNLKFGSNTLVINGPAVGMSQGHPTPYQLGAGYEAGLQYLETIVKANHIIMYGHSFGGATMGIAIGMHDFTFGLENKIKYLSVSDRTFNSAAKIATQHYASIFEPLVHLVGFEFEGVAPAKKLIELGIRQIIIHGHNDPVIPKAFSLSKKLHDLKIEANKYFIESDHIPHSGELPFAILEDLTFQIQKFIYHPEVGGIDRIEKK